jgi:hypothetical protein
VAEYRITRWRTIPAMVTARDPDGQTAKAALPDRFQEAIDEAAMRAGAAGTDAYLEGWVHDEWAERPGGAGDVSAAVAEELDREHPPERLDVLVAELAG